AARPGDLDGEADGSVLVQPARDPLRGRVRHPHARRRGRAHRVPGLRPRALRDGAVPVPRLRSGGVAGGGAGEAVVVKALDLDVTRYARHALHADDRAWVEKNCYVDIWIEGIQRAGAP